MDANPGLPCYAPIVAGDQAAPAANDAPDRPIFVIGPHRSGTTLMYGLLSRHPQLGYLNHANRRMRRTPGLARLLTGGPFFRDKPIEAQKYWDLHWNTPDDVMDAEDATPEAIAFHRKSVRRVLALRGAPRFVAKYPRLSLRLGWIDRVFPGALYLHMVRDWRAVMGSSLRRRVKRSDRGDRWYGVRIPGWSEMGALPHEEQTFRSFLFVTKALEKQGPLYGSRYFPVHYGDLCRDPVSVMREVARHCQLDFPPEFEGTLPRKLEMADHKYMTGPGNASLAAMREREPELFARYEDADNAS